MIKRILLLSIIFTCTTGYLFAQHIAMPLDSIKLILCKTWKADHAVLNGMNIGQVPGATNIIYQFKADGTVVLNTNEKNDSAKGTWIYNANKKLIKLTVNGMSNTNIIALKRGEMILLAAMKDQTPGESVKIQLYLKEI